MVIVLIFLEDFLMNILESAVDVPWLITVTYMY